MSLSPRFPGPAKQPASALRCYMTRWERASVFVGQEAEPIPQRAWKPYNPIVAKNLSDEPAVYHMQPPGARGPCKFIKNVGDHPVHGYLFYSHCNRQYPSYAFRPIQPQMVLIACEDGWRWNEGDAESSRVMRITCTTPLDGSIVWEHDSCWTSLSVKAIVPYLREALETADIISQATPLILYRLYQDGSTSFPRELELNHILKVQCVFTQEGTQEEAQPPSPKSRRLHAGMA